ncbi:MAG TPA: PxKF domain-containing protein [Pyrinomonadaceae bacterium]|jgi:hypothetical protein
MKAITRARFFILLVAVLSLPLISAASASYVRRSFPKNPAPRAATEPAAPRAAAPAARQASPVGAPEAAGFMPFLAAPLQAAPESVAVYQGACGGTPSSSFTIGQTATLCARVSNAPIGVRPTQVLRRLVIVHPSGYIVAKVNVSDDSEDLVLPIPGTATSEIGGEVVDNRGTWQVIDSSYSTGAPIVAAVFTVTDPAQQVADLALSEAAVDAEVAPGANVRFRVYISNHGPDSASNVEITATEPQSDAGQSGATFVSASKDGGVADGFTCSTASGTTTCTAPSLAAGANAFFTLTYAVSGSAAPGSAVVHSAGVTSSTALRSTRDSASKAAAQVNPAAAPAACNLTCPANVVATANTTQGGQSGAFVTFGAASVEGECGAVSNSPTSGSFFPVGTHTVTSSATGDSCTFTVKVLDTAAPTISCPPDKTANAPSGEDHATVDVGTPTYTASGGGTVVGVRSDSSAAEPKALNDPYPVGLTTIVWTVTDADGRTASCTQRVKVNSNSCGTDTEDPTITAPDDVTVGTGAANPGCSITLDDELGQPEVNDNCSVTVTVTGAPAGNNFAPGTYTLTYTATDGAGHSASDTQVVTVVDDTAPIIAAPADATYTCPSEVPAANASQARGPVVGPDGQFVRDVDGELVYSGPAFENCGTANVTVAETNNGGAGSAANPRVITRTYTATDGAGNSASAVQTIMVADGTAPTIAAPADVNVGTGPGAVSCDATISNATLGAATASDNCGAVTVTRSPAGNTFPVGTTTVTWTATDAAGNTATATQTVTVNDTTPPVITPPADVVVYLPLNSTATSVAVNYPNPATATDNCGGPVTVGYSPASGSVFPVGANTVTITATDGHGNSSTAAFTVTVLYNFTGFFSPISNPPTFNQVNAGRSIPVKFSLSGNKGLGIFAAGYPVSQQISCSTNAPVADVEGTGTAGSSSLAYDASSDQYHYVWKTESSWAGTCRVLTVKLNDGSSHTANFKFK